MVETAHLGVEFPGGVDVVRPEGQMGGILPQLIRAGVVLQPDDLDLVGNQVAAQENNLPVVGAFAPGGP